MTSRRRDWQKAEAEADRPQTPANGPDVASLDLWRRRRRQTDQVRGDDDPDGSDPGPRAA